MFLSALMTHCTLLRRECHACLVHCVRTRPSHACRAGPCHFIRFVSTVHSLPVPAWSADPINLLFCARTQHWLVLQATFTFVVRSFTVLDGIGKGLDPRFDISEISAPYARGLLLEGNPQYAALLKEFKKKAGNQNRAFK